MDNHEEKNREDVTFSKDSNINLIVNRPAAEETEIDLVQVFQNFKKKSRVFIWLLLFGIVAGVSMALLMYQINKKPLTVASVVTLRYQIKKENNSKSAEPVWYQVSDLTAPDGKTQLDLSQVSSSYVLQNALNDIELSKEVPLSALRSNIGIRRIPTEESRRQQELINSMMENTNTQTAAYEKAQELNIKYSNQFIVSLTNGFGDEDSGLVYLEDEELRTLLNRILTAYNDYLVNTYGTLKAPSDEISVIDTASLDTVESLDLLNNALKNLETYCEEQEDSIKSYRSWKTGLTLEELKRKTELVQKENLDYLNSHVWGNNLINEPESMLTKYQYELRNIQSELDEVNESITATQLTLDNYKNDDVFVSTQESDASKSTKRTTDYYNELVLSQTENYIKAKELQIKISTLQDKIENLISFGNTNKNETVSEELERAVSVCQNMYNEISNHIGEILESPSYRTFAEASVAQGKTENFLTGSMNNMLVFGAIGAVLALVFWFISALVPEFRRKDEKNDKAGDMDQNNGKEAVAK